MADPRSELIATARALQPAGLNRGTAGNVSVRHGDGYYITPTGMAYDALVEDDIPLMALDGSHVGRRKPSFEWRFHGDLYASRPEVGAVLHAHSPFAVSLACLRLDIPPFHYMIARFGGDTIRCAEYSIFGSKMLSTVALQAMAGRKGCLLANHGMLVAMRMAVMVVVVVRPAEDQRADQIDDQAEDGDGHCFGVVDGLRRPQAFERADDHRAGDAEQHDGAGVAGQHFDFPGAKGEAGVVGVFAGGGVGEGGEADGQRVRAHVPAVGEHGHGVEPPAGDDFDQHGGDGDPHDQPGAAFGRGVADGVAVVVGPAREVVWLVHCWP